MKFPTISIPLVALATAVFANPETQASQDRILTLDGAIAGGEIALTRADVLEFPQHQIVTTTSVTDGPQTFEGFLIRDLLQALDADGDVVVARALNDYQIEIPISDFECFDVIGALSMGGVPLSPRDKGPIWIVYPRDDHPELQDIRYDTRWVWQLVSLHVQ
ncbi:MAG: hypothetical protein JJU07_11420 [Natronohydrobacter sp.]|nr:hypothetical protein [Natronohydrobacter sp.]